MEVAIDDIVSIELIVAERLGAGRLFVVMTSDADFDLRGGLMGFEEADASSCGAESPPRPTIHQSPDGLLCTLIASVLDESMSPCTLR